MSSMFAQKILKCFRLQLIWLTHRYLLMVLRHFSHNVVQPLLLLSSSFHVELLPLRCIHLFWIAVFVTASTDVEKAIMWASKSGNRVFGKVSQRQAFYCEAHPAQGLRDNDFHLGGTRGRCWLFCQYLLWSLMY